MQFLRKVGHFNDIHESSLPAMPERGTVVSYKMQDIYFDPIDKKFNYPRQMSVPVTSNFYDTNHGRWIKIGLVKTVDDKGNISSAHKIWLHPQQTSGALTIKIGESADTDALYQYLELASFVDNGFTRRDENEKIIFKRVDWNKDAQDRRKARRRKTEAAIHARDLSGKGLEEVAYVLGFYDKNEEIMRDRIEEFAHNEPDAYFTRIEDKYANIRAVVNKALQKGVLKFDDAQQNMIWSDTRNIVLILSGAQSPTEQFVSYLQENPEASKIVTEMQRLIAIKDGKASNQKAEVTKEKVEQAEKVEQEDSEKAAKPKK